MQKWRTYYPLIKIKENEAGITLVELLAAISILSIVILLAGSVHMFGQRQFIDQTKSASQENDISYAMTVMSKDLRKKEAGKIKVESNKISEDNESGPPTEIYSIGSNNELKKGNTVLAEGVTGIFQSKDTDEGERVGITIEIKSLAGDGPQKEYETTIYFRR